VSESLDFSLTTFAFILIYNDGDENHFSYSDDNFKK